MQRQNLSCDSVLRPTPLAACLAAIFAVSPLPATAATTWTVNTCNEANLGSGTVGTLRYAVANAASGDTVDMTGLTCSTISLQTGALTVNLADLTLNGPGMNNLVITGKYNNTIEADRVFKHQRAGILRINDLSISFGKLSSISSNAYGGCIYSSGSVYLSHVRVYSCQTTAATEYRAARGGGIFTRGDLTLTFSNISFNSASGDPSADALGGGASVDGLFQSTYSTINGNSVSGIGGTSGFGGGLALAGNVTISNSTISGNSSAHNMGGIAINTGTPASLTMITNGTISGNTATDFVGGLGVFSGTVKLRNSTIAFNTAGRGRTGSTFPYTYYAPGIATVISGAVTLQSSLLANNTYGAASENDLSAGSASTRVTFGGSNNLVRVSFNDVTLPADTIRISCPLLGQLRSNGGPTQTHALFSHSPGIDQGNNSAGLNEDQRGIFADVMPYPYPRVDHGQADIGAYEVQQSDIVFNTSFETCPLL
jgi:hypothetical protein